MSKLKIQTVWELYDHIESLYPDELEKIKPRKVVFVEDLTKVLQDKITRCSQEIKDNETKLQQTTNPDRVTLIKAQIAVLDVGANSYRVVISMLSDSCNKTNTEKKQ